MLDSRGNGRLNSWKEIAAYLGKDTRTAMRYQSRGLPVYRVPGGSGRVFAYQVEIDAWLKGEQARPSASLTDADSSHPFKSPSALHTALHHPRAIGIGLVVAVLISVSIIALRRSASATASSPHVRQITNDGYRKVSVVSDGRQVYFSEWRGGRNVLVRASVETGVTQLLNSPPGNSLPADISPNGEQLLALVQAGHEAERQVWIVPVGGAPRRVGNILGHAAAWSSDSRSIFYSHGNRIYTTPDEGITSRLLHSSELVPQQLHVSVDGKHLRFLSCDPRADTCEPWQITLGAREQTEATKIHIAAPHCCTEWTSSDGSTFFISEAPPDENRIWRVNDNAEYEDAKLISLPAALQNIENVGGGSTLLVNATTPVRDELIRFQPTSKSFTSFLPGTSARYVDFSPDGRRVAYVGPFERTLWISGADGSNAALIYSGALVELPRWSPDGTRIAFTAKRQNEPWRILVISAAGGVPEEAASNNDGQGAPTWSPDGTGLIYANVECEETRTCGVHKITLATKRVETLPQSDGLRTARWSPNGRYVTALDPTAREIKVFDFQTNVWQALAGDINGDDLAWSRDSRYVYGKREAGHESGILRFPVSGAPAQMVVSLESIDQLFGSVFGWFCIAPDGSVLIDRKLESSEIYAVDVAHR